LKGDNSDEESTSHQHFHGPYAGTGSSGIGGIPVSFTQIQSPGFFVNIFPTRKNNPIGSFSITLFLIWQINSLFSPDRRI